MKITRYGYMMIFTALAAGLFLLSGCTEPQEQVACTADAMECPDGSFVGRDSNNNCAFFQCPQGTNNPGNGGISPASEGEMCAGIAGIPCEEGLSCQMAENYPDASGICVESMACTKDAKVCPDGSAVGRDPLSDCEFNACPVAGDEQNSQIANPSATKCIDEGYHYMIVTTDEGQDGVCVFEDGSYCEAWAYFRGECSQGDNSDRVYCTGEKPQACTMEYMPVCGNDGITYGNKCSACADPGVTYWSAGEC